MDSSITRNFIVPIVALRRFLTLLIFWCGITLIYAQATSSLQGRVMLNDTLPAAYATVYLRATGQGVVTDDEGRYLFEGIPVGTDEMEYSYLGYATQTVKLVIDKANHKFAHDVRLEVEPIKLAEVYLTPNGESPATYILGKVAEQAKVNRKRLQAYQAIVTGNLMSRDLDLIPAVLPRLIMIPLHGVLRAAGVNALANYVFDNQNVKANYSFIQTRKGEKSSNAGFQVTNDTPQMSAKVRNQLLNKIVGDDLFDALYGTDTEWYVKKGKQTKWELEGIVEEDGKTIDILRLKNGTDKQNHPTYDKLYIIEDIWAIQRYVASSSFADDRIECRNVGGNIYLPVSDIMTPKEIDLNSEWQKFNVQAADSVAHIVEMGGAETLTKKQKQTLKDYQEMKDSKFYKRIDNALSGNRKYKPTAASSFNVHYRGVVVK